MNKFNTHNIGVEQGSTNLFSDFQHDGIMWTGTGAREFRQIVTFDHPFSRKPIVHVSISMWDFDKDTNQRADISAEMVNREGFAIVFRTWGDTRVARARVDWIAFGEMQDDDDWEVE